MYKRQLLRKEGKTIDELSISPEKLAAIIKMVDAGEINRVSGKKILVAVLKEEDVYKRQLYRYGR